MPATEALLRLWRVSLVAAIVATLLAAVVVLVVVSRDERSGEPAVFKVAGAPTSLAVAPGQLWVAAPRAGGLEVLDADSGRPAGPPVRTGGAPARIALGASSAWVADMARAAVIPVRLRPQREVFAPIELGAEVTDIALAARALWVLSAAEDVVRVLAPGSASLRVPLAGARPVALDADERRVVVAGAGDGSLTAIDARSRRQTGPRIRLGGVPVAVALAGEVAWVADAARDALVRVDLRRGAVSGAPIAVGGRPVAVAADGDDVYVLSARDRELVHVDGVRGEVLSRRTAGTQPVALTLDARYVWVADAGRETVMRFER